MSEFLNEEGFNFCKETAHEILKDLINKKIDPITKIDEENKPFFMMSVVGIMLAFVSQITEKASKTDDIDIMRHIVEFSEDLIMSTRNETDKSLN